MNTQNTRKCHKALSEKDHKIQVFRVEKVGHPKTFRVMYISSYKTKLKQRFKPYVFVFICNVGFRILIIFYCGQYNIIVLSQLHCVAGVTAYDTGVRRNAED